MRRRRVPQRTLNTAPTARIACVWVPHLPAQIERRRVEEERPLLVVEAGRVLDACPQASARGVRPRVARALARCPGARVVEAAPDRYRAAWEMALSRLAAHSPTVEDARKGVAYLEARGMGALYGDERAWCQTLREALAQTDLDARLGVAGDAPGHLGGGAHQPGTPGVLPGRRGRSRSF